MSLQIDFQSGRWLYFCDVHEPGFRKGGVEKQGGFFNESGAPVPGARVEKPGGFFNRCTAGVVVPGVKLGMAELFVIEAEAKRFLSAAKIYKKGSSSCCTR